MFRFPVLVVLLCFMQVCFRVVCSWRSNSLAVSSCYPGVLCEAFVFTGCVLDLCVPWFSRFVLCFFQVYFAGAIATMTTLLGFMLLRTSVEELCELRTRSSLVCHDCCCSCCCWFLFLWNMETPRCILSSTGVGTDDGPPDGRQIFLPRPGRGTRNAEKIEGKIQGFRQSPYATGTKPLPLLSGDTARGLVESRSCWAR